MPPSRHTPAADAPESEWVEYLEGRGYVLDTVDKPVSNYKSLHGFWVPPRLGSGGGGKVKPRAGYRQSEGMRPERSWYSEKMLTALYRHDRVTFAKLVERIANIRELVADDEAAEAVDEHRRLLETGVEAGMFNQAEADSKLKAWAKTQGITIPEP